MKMVGNRLIYILLILSSLSCRSNVKNPFDSISNDMIDDTEQIQKIIDRLYVAKKYELFIPKGKYIISSLEVFPGLQLKGEEGTIFYKKANCGEFNRMLNTKKYQHKSHGSSKTLLIENILFDGNFRNQGKYLKYELEHQSLIFLAGSKKFKGRLKVLIRNCKFQNSVADAMTVHHNVDLEMHDCNVKDVFRGGLVVTGGYSSVVVNNFISEGKVHASGIDMEVKSPGYNNSYGIHVVIKDLIVEGDLDIGLKDNSFFEIDGLNHNNPPFNIVCRDSKVIIKNANLSVGTLMQSKIQYPKNVEFRNCNFDLKSASINDKEKYGIYIVWKTKYYNSDNQSVKFVDCNFNNTVGNNQSTYGVYSNLTDLSDKLTFLNCKFQKGFSIDIYARKGGRYDIRQCEFNGEKGIVFEDKKHKQIEISDVQFNMRNSKAINVKIGSNKNIRYK